MTVSRRFPRTAFGAGLFHARARQAAIQGRFRNRIGQSRSNISLPVGHESAFVAFRGLPAWRGSRSPPRRAPRLTSHRKRRMAAMSMTFRAAVAAPAKLLAAKPTARASATAKVRPLRPMIRRSVRAPRGPRDSVDEHDAEAASARRDRPMRLARADTPRDRLARSSRSRTSSAVRVAARRATTPGGNCRKYPEMYLRRTFADALAPPYRSPPRRSSARRSPPLPA